MPSKKSKATKKPVKKAAPKSAAKSAKTKPKKSAKPTKPKAAPKPAKVGSKPPGFTAVTPHLVCAGAADAIEFYKKAFGAVEIFRMPGPDGAKIMHAQIQIGGAPLMLVDEMPEWGALGPKALKGSPVTVHLYVDDVDALAAQAVAAGATIVMPVTDAFWGDRYGKLEDPFGHQWSIATPQRELSPAEMAAAAQKAFAEMPCPPEPPPAAS